ncbi:MAG: response regulator [Gemmatimonadales bacterium]
MPVPFPALGPTILVVDDERVARRLIYRVLTEEGYRVFEAASADEALSVLEQAHRYVHLIMLDVVMPAVNGVQLGRHILDRWPSLHLLYMSAYPAEILVQHGLEDAQVHFLAKPFTHDELMSRIEVASDRRIASRRGGVEGAAGLGHAPA